ncbi:NTP pyrophosphohydrolase [Streptomyces sp. 150FB]|uniref:NUDIX hydrolase n=1 Tax=Streptomyces sp. 150FB TaxID=1576605 RepID=UPI000589379D|nr:NUDIX hydrolase [Streptomyces sp. 150FB]KIF76365.1 NTP pyrophosphohydrolase [Streptomyces sp. 150FB]
MSTSSHRGPDANASVICAYDAEGEVAVLSAWFPRHSGEYLFLPGGRQELGETPQDCARRELREEAGVTAGIWNPLGTYAITLNSPALLTLYLAEDLALGPRELTDTEQDFKLSWWPLPEAIAAATAGRFLLPGGPLALLLADRFLRARTAG